MTSMSSGLFPGWGANEMTAELRRITPIMEQRSARGYTIEDHLVRHARLQRALARELDLFTREGPKRERAALAERNRIQQRARIERVERYKAQQREGRER